MQGSRRTTPHPVYESNEKQNTCYADADHTSEDNRHHTAARVGGERRSSR
jgi:hypothetical protein